MFVQLYVAAVERGRSRVSSVVEEVEGSCTRGGNKGRWRGGHVSPPSPHIGTSNDDGEHSINVRPGPSSTSAQSRPPSLARIDEGWATKADDFIACKRGRETALETVRKGAHAGAGAETESTRRSNEKQQAFCQLRWLFPAGRGDGGRRAFSRYAICSGGGGDVHGLVTLEAAAAIVRDAGKYISAGRIWRWFCDRSTSGNSLEVAGAGVKPGGASGRRGRLLQFEDFVEMCDGLREHMEDVSIMSDRVQKRI